MKQIRDLRGERGLKVKLPVVVVREGRRISAAKIDAVRMGVRIMGDMGEGRGLHAGEVVVGPTRGREGCWIGDAAAPLEDERYGCQRHREDGQEEKDLRGEGMGRGGGRGR